MSLTSCWCHAGMDFSGSNAFGFNTGRLSNDSTRFSSDNFYPMDGGRRSRSEGPPTDFRW